MGDRTALTFLIPNPGDLPPGYELAIRDTFASFVADHTAQTDAGRMKMEGNEASVGSAEEAAQALLDLMKGDPDAEPPLPPHQFAFTVWEDPKYEWLGTLYRYTPGQPMFTAECDASGRAVIEFSQIAAAIAATTDRDGLIARLRHVYGEPADAPRDGIYVSRDRLEEYAGQPLTDEQVRRIADAVPHSSIPEAIATIASHLDIFDHIANRGADQED